MTNIVFYPKPPRGPAVFAQLPYLRRRTAGARPYAAGFKRIFECTLVLAMAPLALLLLAPAAAAVALDGHGVLLRQTRVGKDGRRFHLLKLRTMVPDAEARLRRHLVADPAARRAWDRDQKLPNDPRITRAGRILRRYSLDELPQLWNVLRGEMALIGPRPMLEEQCRIYDGEAYFALRPGITGLWQVSARNDCSFARRARYDTEYFHRCSLALDLWICGQTLRVLCAGTGR